VSRIEVREVAKTLGGRAGTAVLRGVSFQVAAGHCVGLRGATGSGKTTLLRLIAGLDRLERGEILLDGHLVSGPTVHVPPHRRGVGLVFQNLGLWPHLRVAEHLDYVLSATPLSSPERERRKGELLEAFRLRGLERRLPAELSGGEKHLLALARALAGEVRVLLLDEPFTGLDGQLKDCVMNALASWRASHRLTALLVSHDAEDLARLCQSVLCLREGRMAELPEVVRRERS
jgi:iron(III) transport system ATP-binding protein